MGGYLAKETVPGRTKAVVPGENSSFLPEGISRKESMNAQFLHGVAKTAPELLEEIRSGDIFGSAPSEPPAR